MIPAVSLQIDSDLDSVELVAKAVRALCSDKLGEDMLADVELSVVEAINNVIKHGYRGEKGLPVEVKISIKSDRVVLDIFDEAPPMPGSLLEPDTAALFDFNPENLDELPEGGMGLSLIKMTMDEISYSSQSGINRLTLTKLFENPGTRVQ
ncbi:ATP-binding protein [Devosia sp. RR2S18]|jgi:serine/threonine-protein kinase RsbW|uniref:ATP-binding protein n=1 Tax=Devosia rhizosphaerae TaxID=3049774 RepID=UPI00253FDEAE|nr:ATP-binding protein [Devosia sp. RR2S18]WIJ23780.1 ATP-binding protein [Devosia sp. RR2S18]